MSAEKNAAQRRIATFINDFGFPHHEKNGPRGAGIAAKYTDPRQQCCIVAM
jgi:hypothetical protein